MVIENHPALIGQKKGFIAFPMLKHNRDCFNYKSDPLRFSHCYYDGDSDAGHLFETT